MRSVLGLLANSPWGLTHTWDPHTGTLKMHDRRSLVCATSPASPRSVVQTYLAVFGCPTAPLCWVQGFAPC